MWARRYHGRPLYLTRNDNHRHRIKPGPHHAGKGIRSARPCRNGNHSWRPRHPCIALGGHRASLFMKIADILDSLLATKCVIEMHCTAPRHKEHMLHALVGEELPDVVCNSHAFSFPTRSTCSTRPSRTCVQSRSCSPASRRPCRGRGRSKARSSLWCRCSRANRQCDSRRLP